MQIVSSPLAHKINKEFECSGIKKPNSAYFYDGDNLFIGNAGGVNGFTMDEAASALPVEITKHGHRYHFYVGKTINPYKETVEVQYIAGYANRTGSAFVIEFHNANPAEAMGELLCWYLKEGRNV